MKVICMPVFNRPTLFSGVLRSIYDANPDSKWHLHISIEPSSERDAITRILYNPRPHVHQWVNPKQFGCSLNAFTVCYGAFAQGADAVLYTEDDIFLSLDAITLCDWFIANEHLGDGGLALCQRYNNDPSRPDEITVDSQQGLLGQGWCVTRKIWKEFALRNWWAHEPEMGDHDIWDWSLGHMAQKLGKRILRPRLSRSRHIGAVGFHGPSFGVFPDTISDGRHTNYKPT